MFVPEQDLKCISLGRLESEITELAAHIYAATCRWLCLVAEFDRREGWAQWGCGTCAQWLSWRCGLGPAAAREHVRVARRLAELPDIRATFSRGELSYSQVRALTRVATPDSEAGLLSIARHATAAQLELVVRAYRGVLSTEPAAADRAHEQRYVACSHDDDGSLLIHARLPAEEGATVLAALDAGRAALRAEEPADGLEDVSAETSAERRRAGDADALVLMADSLLVAPAQGNGGERYQVVVHVDAGALRDDDPAGRCHLERGPALNPEAARRLSCDSSLVRILEADGDRPLSVGRKTRSIPPAVRRALTSRDGGCRFPGCTHHRFIDAHHIRHWVHGGHTKLSNLITLCRRHHRLVHEGGYRIEDGPRGGVRFRRPDGRLIPSAPRTRRGDPHELTRGNHRRTIGPDTCVSRWNGDPLDLGAAVDAIAEADPRVGADAPPPEAQPP